MGIDWACRVGGVFMMIVCRAQNWGFFYRWWEAMRTMSRNVVDSFTSFLSGKPCSIHRYFHSTYRFCLPLEILCSHLRFYQASRQYDMYTNSLILYLDKPTWRMGWNTCCDSESINKNSFYGYIKMEHKESRNKSHKENRSALKFNPGYFTILKNIITAKTCLSLCSWMRILVPLNSF